MSTDSVHIPLSATPKPVQNEVVKKRLALLRERKEMTLPGSYGGKIQKAHRQIARRTYRYAARMAATLEAQGAFDTGRLIHFIDTVAVAMTSLEQALCLPAVTVPEQLSGDESGDADDVENVMDVADGDPNKA